jgi:hypothetical protein
MTCLPGLRKFKPASRRAIFELGLRGEMMYAGKLKSALTLPSKEPKRTAAIVLHAQ